MISGRPGRRIGCLAQTAGDWRGVLIDCHSGCLGLGNFLPGCEAGDNTMINPVLAQASSLRYRKPEGGSGGSE